MAVTAAAVRAPLLSWVTARNVLSLLSSGAISTVCLVLMTSQRVQIVSAADSTFVTLFMQWQMLTLTVAKVGLDSVVFAVMSGLPERRTSVRRVWFRIVLPLAAGVALLTVHAFGWAGATVCGLSAVVDAWSAAQIAWRGAREQYRAVMLANLFNYPLFFLSVFVFSASGWQGPTMILACFLGTSIARAGYLASLARDGVPVEIRINAEIAGQQALNYVMFKSDQLLLGVVGASMLMATDVGLRQFLFLCRFPELVSSVAVALGVIFLPRLLVNQPGSLKAVAKSWGLTPRRVSLGLIALGAAFGTFLAFWRGPLVAWWMLPPFALSAALVVPANTMTYSMLRGGHARALLRNLVVSLCLGAICLGTAILEESFVALAWSVPVQLLTFIVMCAKLPWLEPRRLHV